MAGAVNLWSRGKLVTAPNANARVKEQYIIVFKESVIDVDSKIKSMVEKIPGSRPIFTYRENFKGFAIGRLPDRFLSIILEDDDVVLVEEARINCLKFCKSRVLAIDTSAVKQSYNNFRFPSLARQDQIMRIDTTVQSNPPWGLD